VRHFGEINKVKVAVVSIMKNEEKFIKRWAESCADADYRILLDTGSSDNSVQVAKDCGVIVHEKVIEPWHFARARNYLLDLIPDDVDWIINLDVDEVLGRGWHDALKGVPTDGSVNRPRYRLCLELETF
jgi:glycosyltransferase involved in cell wall biosynthesis